MQRYTTSSSHGDVRAGWIPIRVDLHSTPEVVRLARLSNRGVDEIVGLLVRFWSWASQNSSDGVLRGLQPMDVSLASNVPVEFLCAMSQAGWLCVDEDGTMRVPKFERWFGRNHNEPVQNGADASTRAAPTRGIDWSKVSFPGGCDTEEVRQAIDEWVEYRRKIRKRYVDAERQVSMLLKRYGADIVEAIKHSIAQGFQGCYLPSRGSARNGSHKYGHDPL